MKVITYTKTKLVLTSKIFPLNKMMLYASILVILGWLVGAILFVGSLEKEILTCNKSDKQNISCRLQIERLIPLSQDKEIIIQQLKRVIIRKEPYKNYTIVYVALETEQGIIKLSSFKEEQGNKIKNYLAHTNHEQNDESLLVSSDNRSLFFIYLVSMPLALSLSYLITAFIFPQQFIYDFDKITDTLTVTQVILSQRYHQTFGLSQIKEVTYNLVRGEFLDLGYIIMKTGKKVSLRDYPSLSLSFSLSENQKNIEILKEEVKGNIEMINHFLNLIYPKFGE